MADLATALDAALRDRYPVAGLIKSPATGRRGLTARMNALEKVHTAKGDRKGAGARKAAQEAGISLRTWERWRKGEQKPGPKLLAKLQGAYERLVTLPKLRKRVNALPLPDRVNITAVVNWNGYYNRTAYRTVQLAYMRPRMRAVVRAWALDGPEAAADALQAAVATSHGVEFVRFEGDNAMVEFP